MLKNWSFAASPNPKCHHDCFCAWSAAAVSYCVLLRHECGRRSWTTVVSVSVGGSKFPVPNKSSAFLSAAAKSNVTCWLPALPFQPFWVFCFWDWLRTLNLYSGVAPTQEAQRKISFFPFSQQKKNQSGFLAIWCSAKIQHTHSFYLKCSWVIFILCLFVHLNCHGSWFE